MKKCFFNYVGVIDSGVGGLTILKQLQRKYPNCNFVYIADSARCPYGTKQPQEILQRVNQLIKFLQNCGVQAVVIACNTASIHVNTLRQQFNLPIYEVITPTCERVINAKSKRVALLATNATIKSNVYQSRLNASDITVLSFPCSVFVPFVEANKVNTAECSEAVDRALHNLSSCNVDAVILGCTHFPLLRKKIAPFAYGATIIECCTNFHPSAVCIGKCETVFLTTGEEKQAYEAAGWFGEVEFIHIDI